MKNLILLLLLCVCIKGKAQDEPQSFTIIGMGAGYSLGCNASHVILVPEFGFKTGNIFVSTMPQLNLNNVSYIPVVLPINAGLNLSQFQPFVSCSYQTIGNEEEAFFKGTKYEFKNGFKAGGGISYYFDNFPIQMTLQRQGKINNLSVIIYTHL